MPLRTLSNGYFIVLWFKNSVKYNFVLWYKIAVGKRLNLRLIYGTLEQIMLIPLESGDK